MWRKDLAAMNAAAGEREPPAPPRAAILEKRIDALQKRLDTVEHVTRILVAALKRISK